MSCVACRYSHDNISRTLYQNKLFSLAHSEFFFFVILLIFQYCLILSFRIFPCCSTTRKRKIWRKRIKERRWHVYVPQEEPEDWFLAALERYRAAQQREDEAQRQGGTANSLTQVAADIVWKEKEEAELRRALTDDLLRDFTKVRTFTTLWWILDRSWISSGFSF